MAPNVIVGVEFLPIVPALHAPRRHSLVANAEVRGKESLAPLWVAPRRSGITRPTAVCVMEALVDLLSIELARLRTTVTLVSGPFGPSFCGRTLRGLLRVAGREASTTRPFALADRSVRRPLRMGCPLLV